MIEKVLRDLRECLLLTRTKYAIVGGLAVSKWGRPRATLDVDVLAEIRDDAHLSKLLEKLRLMNFKMVAIDRKLLKILKHDVPIDLVAAEFPFEHQLISNSVRVKILGIYVKIARPEDLIVMKAIGRRAQDIADIQNICETSLRRIDRAYLMKTAADVGPETYKLIKDILSHR